MFHVCNSAQNPRFIMMCLSRFQGNWYKAFHYCTTHNMRLATIKSKEENAQFVKVAADAGEYDISKSSQFGSR